MKVRILINNHLISMKQNLLSILIGALISFTMSFTGNELFKGLVFSLIGGFMGFIGNTICRHFLHKAEKVIKYVILKFKRKQHHKKHTR